MKTLRDLMTPPAHIQGRIDAIVVRGAPRERARLVPQTMALAGIGLADDRLGRRGEAELSTRQVTLGPISPRTVGREGQPPGANQGAARRPH